MPLHIILQDITKIECDAIVNAANSSLLGGGGVDGCIHRAAGPSLLAECRTLGGCPTGEAKLTKGYRLPAKYVIHTVGPIWQGGNFGEERLLRSCYKNSLQLAKEYGCESIAFPLISSGIYGYPKAAALAVAVEEIKAFLLENELTAYIVVFDKANFQIDDTLYSQVFDYILEQGNPYADVCKSCADLDEDIIPTPADALYSPKLFELPKRTELFDGLEDGFSVTLLRLLDRKGVDEVACYKKANVSRQTWYKILNQKDYNPSKNTILSFAIALELDLEETKQLLSTAGYALSKSSKFDLIIEYFITNDQYDIFLINETLFKFDQPCLSM